MSQCQRSEIEIIEARNVSREQKTCRAEAFVRRRRRCMVARRMWSPHLKPTDVHSFGTVSPESGSFLHYFQIYTADCQLLPTRNHPKFVSFPPTQKWRAEFRPWRHDRSQRSEKYPRRGFRQRQRRRCCTKLTDLIVIGSGDVGGGGGEGAGGTSPTRRNSAF